LLDAAFTDVLSELFARNRDASGRRDYYGVRVAALSATERAFELVISFKDGETYCCAELGCHVGYHDRRWWRALRRLMQECTVNDTRPLALHIRGIIEPGARLRCNASFGLPEESAGYTCESGPHVEITDG
jgi:hypothetical protein